MGRQTTNSLIGAIGNAWALLLGFGVLMLGDGLQVTLLAVRAHTEDFSTILTGLIMSAFYVGFLSGTLWAPRIVNTVGHIRVFAALAAVASVTILVHASIVHPVAWFLLRLISGFCFSGLYVVVESWLNSSATNETRGQLLSVYMVITYLAVGAGQLLLNLADPGGYQLFILISILISTAVVPILLIQTPAPNFDNANSVNLEELFNISPLGVFGMFWVGLATAAIFSLGPLYASQMGLSTADISYFMLAPVVATILLQWPIGQLSDRFDRRWVILVVTTVAAIAALLCIVAARFTTLYVTITFGIFGGFSLPLYALCVAHTNDHLQPSQMVGASGGLILASGLGATIGPIGIALMMDVSSSWFFGALAVAHAGIGLYTLYRMSVRSARPIDEQGHHAPVTLSRSPRMIETIQTHLRDEYPQQD